MLTKTQSGLTWNKIKHKGKYTTFLVPQYKNDRLLRLKKKKSMTIHKNVILLSPHSFKNVYSKVDLRTFVYTVQYLPVPQVLIENNIS